MMNDTIFITSKIIKVFVIILKFLLKIEISLSYSLSHIIKIEHLTFLCQQFF